jgi:hypothetical protein
MLLGELDLDASPAVAALGKVDGKFSATTGALAKAGAIAGAGFKGVEMALEAVGKGFEMMKETMDLGGTLTDLSLRTGETVGSLVILREAFQEAGLGADGVEGFFGKLQNALGGVNEEGGKTSDAFDALKTSAEELRGLDAIGQIEKLQAGFAGIADQGTRVQVARNLFGKSGGSALSLLGDPKVLDDARKAAGPLADVMEKNAATFDRMGDVIGSLKLDFQEFFAGALSKIAPEATTIAEALSSIDFVGIGEGVGTLAGVVLKLGEAFVLIAPAINWVSEKLSWLLGSGSTASAGLAEKYRGFAKVVEPLADGDKSPVSALQKIGGGGGFGGSDPLLNETQRQTSLLQKLIDLQSRPSIGGNTLLDAPAV